MIPFYSVCCGRASVSKLRIMLSLCWAPWSNKTEQKKKNPGRFLPPDWETCSRCGACRASLAPPPTTRLCLELSDLLSSGESVYTNPKSSAIKEAGAEQLQALLLSSARVPAPHHRQESPGTPERLLGSLSICCTPKFPPSSARTSSLVALFWHLLCFGFLKLFFSKNFL